MVLKVRVFSSRGDSYVDFGSEKQHGFCDFCVWCTPEYYSCMLGVLYLVLGLVLEHRCNTHITYISNSFPLQYLWVSLHLHHLQKSSIRTNFDTFNHSHVLWVPVFGHVTLRVRTVLECLNTDVVHTSNSFQLQCLGASPHLHILWESSIRTNFDIFDHFHV